MADDTTGTQQTRGYKRKTKADKIADFLASPFEDPTPETRAFYARFLILAGMPYSNPGPVQDWTRSAFDRILVVRPGHNLDRSRWEGVSINGPYPHVSGFPYGINPRYILAWIATEVRKTKSPNLYTGDSLVTFMNKVGLPCTGGPNGTIERFITQFWNLVTAEIITIPPVEPGKPFHPTSFRISDPDGFYVWGEKVCPGGNRLAGIEFSLTPKCYEELSQHSVPFNPFSLRAFTGSAFQFDIYLWLVYRLHERTKSTPLITWEHLKSQFGSNTKELRFFRKHFLRALNPVRDIYRDARIDILDEGLILHPSKPDSPIVG